MRIDSNFDYRDIAQPFVKMKLIHRTEEGFEFVRFTLFHMFYF